MQNHHAHANAGAIAVYGATGHTGGFVLAELARRGLPMAAVTRKPAEVRGVATRVASLDDPGALRRAFADCAVVINAAGPFLDTATPVIDAALSAGCHYLDITAEQESARTSLRDHDDASRERGLALIPAAGFYGGLADLLASALARDGIAIDAIDVAIALDHWWPTAGTRLTGARNTFPRVVVEGGTLVPMPQAANGLVWDFGPPLGKQSMEPVPLSEMISLAHHLPVRRVRSYLGANALRDLRDPATPAPAAIDALGRSPQRFTMQVVLQDTHGVRRATAHGRDIYAVSAPLVVEAAARLRTGGGARPGAQSLGSAFDPLALLHALAPTHFDLDLQTAIRS